MPHPVTGGLKEIEAGHIKDGWGHVWNGVVHRHKTSPTTQPTTQPSTVPSADEE